jgi:hypothetical protein
MSWKPSLVRAAGVAACLLVFTAPSHAQFWGGFGGFGWGGWGMNYANNPNEGYMRGLGQYSLMTSQGSEFQAKARSINTDTVIKWNKAVRENQAKQKAEIARKRAEQQKNLVRQSEVEAVDNGDALNALMNEISEFPSAQARSLMTGTPVTPAAIRRIPFELESEGISFSLGQMTSDRNMPPGLQGERFAEQRQTLRTAIQAAIKEDEEGEVSDQSVQSIKVAVLGLHNRLDQAMSALNPLYAEADQYLRSLAILAHMLESRKFQNMLRKLADKTDASLADLLSFMHAYNLRFGPAQNDDQKQLYRRLKPILEEIAGAGGAGAAVAGGTLPEAVRATFSDLTWQEIEAGIKPDPDAVDLKKDQ